MRLSSLPAQLLSLETSRLLQLLFFLQFVLSISSLSKSLPSTIMLNDVGIFYCTGISIKLAGGEILLWGEAVCVCVCVVGLLTCTQPVLCTHTNTQQTYTHTLTHSLTHTYELNYSMNN